MESFLSDAILPGKDISTLLMSPGANKQDVIRFDKLMRGIANDGVRILDGPENAGRQSDLPPGMAVEALGTLEQVQLSTQDHLGQAMDIMTEMMHYKPLDEKMMELDPLQMTEKLQQDMHTQAGKMLKAQMHMNLFSVTVSIVNRVASNVNEGIKTLYRQQG